MGEIIDEKIETVNGMIAALRVRMIDSYFLS
jgi:hypothetical protein